MENNLNEFKLAAAALVGTLTGFWGWLGWLVVTWVMCMVGDYITGSMAAAKAGDWTSSQAREGIFHKGGMIVIVLVAAATDLLISLILTNMPILSLPVAYSGLVCPIVLVWYIVTELGSITENAVKMGAPVPSALTRLLKVAGEAVEQVGEKMVETVEKESKDESESTVSDEK